ncbi:MAG: EAL domain-containing protein [Actinobacteria bacterium]|nr:MAG: EAL domain-containing protein [Actinomycetota bacterium]
MVNPQDKDPQTGSFGFHIERDLLCTVNSDGYFTSLNSGWERVLGWTREELQSRPIIDFIHPADRERTVAELAKVARTDYQVVNFENRYRARGGGWRWLRWSARTDGQNWYAVAFDITQDKETEARLRGVLTDEHLLAYSQPILDHRRGEIVQEELLVRMRNTTGTDRVLTPAEFLPDAERTGLIGLVDRWMSAHAVALSRQGRRSEVNLSAVSIGDEEFTGRLEKWIDRAGVNPSNLVFEITETAALEQLDVAVGFAERLTSLGCRFALDDFGTGFGSLTHLRVLPIHYLKIDTSFVRDAATNRDDQAMLRGIVAIARELRMMTVAEGIEDARTLELVSDIGVDYAQGYHIGRPAPVG